jgi:Trk K+ transport system NAD-binding subunit
VPTQRDSPAHYMEHIQIALRLLGKRNLHLAENLGHLDLLRLMRSKIRFDLPGGKELAMAQVPEGSSLAGQTIGSFYQRLKEYEFEIIAVMRREHVLLPHPETVLEARDRLILITSPQAREPLAQCVTPLPMEEEPRAQVPAAESPF